MTRNFKKIHFSVVSHGHGLLLYSSLKALSASLTEDLSDVCVWLTLNLPEPDLEQMLAAERWCFELRVIRNSRAQGFGANHNQAFVHAKAAQAMWFVVLNPDIYFPQTAYTFWRSLDQDTCPADVGLLCPAQVDAQGQPQDFARRLMTPWGLAARLIRRAAGMAPSGVAESVATADWVNGACMVWRSEAFAALQGFDERYFMYCEDADICLRLQLAGWRMCSANLAVVHDAQRQTARNWRHLRWHMTSMLRLWCSRTFWRYLRWRRLAKS